MQCVAVHIDNLLRMTFSECKNSIKPVWSACNIFTKLRFVIIFSFLHVVLMQSRWTEMAGMDDASFICWNASRQGPCIALFVLRGACYFMDFLSFKYRY